MFTPKGIPASKDTAPQALVEGLDFAKMKTDYGVLGASLNGPKIWTPDWSEMEIGVERDFNGMKAIWVAQLNMCCARPHSSRSPRLAPLQYSTTPPLNVLDGYLEVSVRNVVE
jgi:hypothetical protein